MESVGGALSPCPSQPYASDGQCILDAYRQWGETFARQFDGEFAIAIFDLERQQVTISTDQFAIKPMWITHAPDAGSFGVSTYKSALLRAGHVEAHIAEAEPNIVAVYSFESDPQRRGRPTMFRHVRSERLYAWDLRQHKTEIEAWERAFEEAVRRRTAGAIHPVFLPLSDGYDSGAIHLALHRLGVPHTTYTVGLNTEQVSARLKYGKSSAAAQYVVRLTEGDFREVSSDLKERCEPYTYNSARWSNPGLSEPGFVRGELKDVRVSQVPCLCHVWPGRAS